jgi:hypothetical protein
MHMQSGHSARLAIRATAAVQRMFRAIATVSQTADSD